MKTVKYCDDFEAQVIKGRLENEGIQAFVINELTPSMLPWATATPYAAVQVAVAEEDYERAMQILSLDTQPDPETICCPECGSEDVVYGFWRRKSLIAKIFGVFALAFQTSTGAMRNRYTCKKCGYEFK